MPRSLACLLLLVAACGGGEDDGGDPAAPAAGISIASPEDGATVPATFPVTMEAAGLTIEAAGAVAEGSGHFHLIVDGDCVAAGEEIPADETHIHLADGASDTELTLPAGEHTLCLQAGDGQHAALALTDQITVNVGAGDEGETTTLVDGREWIQIWRGTYEGRVLLECSPGDVYAKLEAEFVGVGLLADDPMNPFLQADHTTTGSCLGPDGGRATGRIELGGRRTPAGFVFPSSVAYGVPGSFILRINGNRLEGRLSGEVADEGAGELTIVFALECDFGC